MFTEIGTYGLSLAAGTLSTLSPCVLPLVPILVGSALMTHRFGPHALATGLALSFTLVGVFIVGLGTAVGLDQEVFRNIAAVLLVGFGIVLVSPALQARFAVTASTLGGAGQSLTSRISGDSLGGQFSLGLLLGVVWSPCVGPTLGATITLASQGQDLGHVALMMALFGLGAGIPLVLLGMLSRQAMTRFRDKLLGVGKTGKGLLGGVLMVMGILILTGMDKELESLVLHLSPDWLTDLTSAI